MSVLLAGSVLVAGGATVTPACASSCHRKRRSRICGDPLGGPAGNGLGDVRVVHGAWRNVGAGADDADAAASKLRRDLDHRNYLSWGTWTERGSVMLRDAARE
jgi:hypothetical protein